jgi:hypothetical protein
MIDLVIHHDGRDWVARGEGVRASGATLDDLDDAVRRILIESGRLEDEVKVHMAFDSSTIPEWIRPYAQHYFNRVVEMRA